MYSFTNQPLTFLAVEYAERLVLFFYNCKISGANFKWLHSGADAILFIKKNYSKRQGELGPSSSRVYPWMKVFSGRGPRMLSLGLWRVNKLSIKTLKLKRTNEKLQTYILKTLEGRLLHKDYWVKHIWPENMEILIICSLN